jgi:transcriptional regulator with XRE-family HTH domain
MFAMKVLQDYLSIAGVSQAELARRTEISIEEINRFVQGKREPRIKNLRKISKATGISLEKLVESLGQD